LQINAEYWWRVKGYNTSGWGNFSKVQRFNTNIVSVEREEIPIEYALEQNYPNPFNPTTTIQYSVMKRSTIQLVLYDILGREVEILVNKEQDAGHYNIDFNAGNLASGVYLYKLKAGDFVETKKMVLMK
jgi:hypothetical protein